MVQAALLSSFPVLLAFVGVVKAVNTCNVTSPCTLYSAPCCSEYGFCGTDNFCLGGCNPYASKTLTSCRPEPLCQNNQFTFADQSRILSNSTLFDGNSSTYDWVLDKGTIQNNNGDVALILTETNGGTRLSSTRYVYYGTITARLKTGRWDGVVTAFITMSDIRDEIDWEWPGSNTTTAQSNFFWQGVIPNKTQGETHAGLSDTFSNYHDYTIDWQPDQLTWLIDGNSVRILKKSDTVDSNGMPHYPSTPSRIQLSLWPAGIAGIPQGTVTWSGGMINWNDPDYKAAGHFYASVNQVTVNCSTAYTPSNPNITSYVYSGSQNQSSTPTITLSNHSTLLNGANNLVPAIGTNSLSLALFLGLLLGSNAFLL